MFHCRSGSCGCAFDPGEPSLFIRCKSMLSLRRWHGWTGSWTTCGACTAWTFTPARSCLLRRRTRAARGARMQRPPRPEEGEQATEADGEGLNSRDDTPLCTCSWRMCSAGLAQAGQRGSAAYRALPASSCAADELSSGSWLQGTSLLRCMTACSVAWHLLRLRWVALLVSTAELCGLLPRCRLHAALLCF